MFLNLVKDAWEVKDIAGDMVLKNMYFHATIAQMELMPYTVLLVLPKPWPALTVRLLFSLLFLQFLSSHHLDPNLLVCVCVSVGFNAMEVALEILQ